MLYVLQAQVIGAVLQVTFLQAPNASSAANLLLAAAAGCCCVQGIASAPLYDSQCGAVVGVISASDFIHTLRRLRNAVSSGSNPLSEAEMDAHTVRAGGSRLHCV
jgi:hypothetical protein